MEPDGQHLPALEVAGVNKSFNGIQVLEDARLSVRAGTIHALVGHNGSGKSTLIKLLAGFHKPDRPITGKVFGELLHVGDHHDADRAGLRFVHQDLGLVDALDTVDNLALGPGYPRRAGLISWPEAARRARSALEALEYDFDVTRAVGTLSASQRTGVAIARALQDWSGRRAVVVLDEPTAAMPAQDVGSLFRAVRALRDRGLGVVYVSHHLHEVLELADDVTVLREGRVVSSRPVAGLTHDALVQLIVGSTIERSTTPEQPAVVDDRTPALSLKGFAAGTVSGLELDVRAGEIVGVVGVDGSGRDAILPAIAGLQPHRGEVRVAGRLVRSGRPRDAMRAGTGYVPADRLRNAVVPALDVTSNLTISGLAPYQRLGLVSRRAEAEDALIWLDRVGVVSEKSRVPILTLSGGNQQKVMVGRWLRRKPALLALDEPTQGVDVGARELIYRLLRDAASSGCGVLVGSSSTDEVLDLCHRVIVIAHGQAVANLSCSELTEERLNTLALSPKKKA